MPNRDIKESCRISPTLALLSHGAERLFWRLTTYADDWGRMPADASVVLGACMPRLLEAGRLKFSDVGIWLAELEQAGLIRRYQANGQTFAFFVSWRKHQQVRAKRSKYPDPPSDLNCAQLPADVLDSTEKTLTDKPILRSPSSGSSSDIHTQARSILEFLNHKTGRHYQPTPTNLDLIRARLRSGATADQCHAVIGRKVAEWRADPKMSAYLRPATLFNATKFEQYRGELPASAFERNGGPPDA